MALFWNQQAERAHRGAEGAVSKVKLALCTSPCSRSPSLGCRAHRTACWLQEVRAGAEQPQELPGRQRQHAAAMQQPREPGAGRQSRRSWRGLRAGLPAARPSAPRPSRLPSTPAPSSAARSSCPSPWATDPLALIWRAGGVLPRRGGVPRPGAPASGLLPAGGGQQGEGAALGLRQARGSHEEVPAAVRGLPLCGEGVRASCWVVAEGAARGRRRRGQAQGALCRSACSCELLGQLL